MAPPAAQRATAHEVNALTLRAAPEPPRVFTPEEYDGRRFYRFEGRGTVAPLIAGIVEAVSKRARSADRTDTVWTLRCRSAAACPAGSRKTIPNTGSNPQRETHIGELAKSRRFRACRRGRGVVPGSSTSPRARCWVASGIERAIAAMKPTGGDRRRKGATPNEPHSDSMLWQRAPEAAGVRV